MKRSLAVIACLAVLAAPAHAQPPAASAPAQPAPAAPTASQDGPPPDLSVSTGFLVMDMSRLGTEAKAMKSVFDQMAKRHDIEVAAYNMALDKLEKEFEPVRLGKDRMDPAEYQKAVDQYNTIKTQIDEVLKGVQDGMTAAAEKAIDQFNTVASVIGQQVRQDYGVSRFVDGSSVLYVRPGSGYDVTDEVIRRIDQKLPEIKVEFPARKPAPGASADKPDAAKPAAKKK
jgi:Skp family chaperone for outer membrane proteins